MTANLYEKNDRYHVMLSWYQNEKRKQKSIATGIPTQGNNKRKAEAVRKQALEDWQEKVADNFQEILFSDYLSQWLEMIKYSIADTTYSEYKSAIDNRISPYFAKLKISLHDLKPHHIQAFYTWKMSDGEVSGNTIHHYHANISKALKDAVKLGHIKSNPAERVTLPKKEKYKADFYTTDELRKLLSIVNGTKLEVPVMFACWFGMRRGEIVGARWDAIDFQSKTFYMRGTITDKGEGTQTENLAYHSFGKTPASIRAFPLTDEMVTYLKAIKCEQSNNRILAGGEYSEKWHEFVCVDKVGNLIQPEYISYTFPKVLAKNGLRKIRFHDLRHTNATLLLEDGASMKDVQDWMGHKSFSTTADTYAHVQTRAKQRLSESMTNLLSGE